MNTPPVKKSDKKDAENTSLKMNATQNIWNQLKLSNPLYQEVVSTYTIPITFCVLPAYIDEIWMSIKNDQSEIYQMYTEDSCRDVLKKVMLILAEAKVCCAQRTIPLERHLGELPQKHLYFHEELLELNSLVEDLPYPLAAYLECIGVFPEGNRTLIPVLAKSQDGRLEESRLISYAPRYMETSWPDIERKSTSAILQDFPSIIFDKNDRLSPSFYSFWFVCDKICLSESDKRIFRGIASDFTGLKTQINLLNGRGNLSQIVQTPEWSIDSPIEFYSTISCSEFYLKLGAAFGFTYTQSRKVQQSRYYCNDITAHRIAEVTPTNVIKCILKHSKKIEA
ncbi:uncharacterized protein LOC123675941 [Harmonia axyridis]|uniref:uncharacterized protein LOC123675941 n=1 Tax=Harmonia axyridis TaxID=115357 RepID=UPI001E275152|nr:uncharacterized protein LOC123675941 [Harmonia axyridis]